jgi:hypothetical protein
LVDDQVSVAEPSEVIEVGEAERVTVGAGVGVGVVTAAFKKLSATHPSTPVSKLT